jgi:hypothetical protein
MKSNLGGLKIMQRSIRIIVPQDLPDEMQQNTEYTPSILMKPIPEYFLFYTLHILTMKSTPPAADKS